MKLKFGIVIALYDFWVGFYVSREKRRVYILPFPCVGFWIDWSGEKP